MLFWKASWTWDTFSSASKAAFSGGMISCCIISGSGSAAAFFGLAAAAGFAAAAVASLAPSAASFFLLTSGDQNSNSKRCQHLRALSTDCIETDSRKQSNISESVIVPIYGTAQLHSITSEAKAVFIDCSVNQLKQGENSIFSFTAHARGAEKQL